MKKLITLILILFLFVSCLNKNSNENKNSVEKKEVIQINIPKNNLEKLNKLTERNKPLDELQVFIRKMEMLNWLYDTNIVNKLCNKETIKYYGNVPFCKLNFEETDLFEKYTKKDEKIIIEEPNDSIVSDNKAKTRTQLIFEKVDIDLFRKVKNIWKYYYKKDIAEEFIPDGVIEQWQFDNENQAKEALKQIELVGQSLLYINTTPYYVAVKKSVLIFHTKAMMFSYNQKELYKLFIENYIFPTKSDKNGFSVARLDFTENLQRVFVVVDKNKIYDTTFVKELIRFVKETYPTSLNTNISFFSDLKYADYKDNLQRKGILKTNNDLKKWMNENYLGEFNLKTGILNIFPVSDKIEKRQKINIKNAAPNNK